MLKMFKNKKDKIKELEKIIMSQDKEIQNLYEINENLHAECNNFKYQLLAQSSEIEEKDKNLEIQKKEIHSLKSAKGGYTKRINQLTEYSKILEDENAKLRKQLKQAEFKVRPYKKSDLELYDKIGKPLKNK